MTQELTKEEIKAIVAKAYSGEWEYERDRPYFEEVAGHSLPKWSDLTPEQQANVKQSQVQYAAEMDAFGKSLVSKKPGGSE